jgi:hypothetical protein
VSDSFEITIAQEIANPRHSRPHMVLLGAGATRAALPGGDANGKNVPLLAEVADLLGLDQYFPAKLRDLARTDFEAAFSSLHEAGHENVLELETQIRKYFTSLRIPSEPTIYDHLILGLRPKDHIFSFNWDPILPQAAQRIYRSGHKELPQLHFLHGNVVVGYCALHDTRGIGVKDCLQCQAPFEPSRLLYPVAKKNYLDGDYIESEWHKAESVLRNAFFLTVFGYSAPDTDKEAVDLLLNAWGTPDQRFMEQLEIIDRPGANEEQLRNRWKRFIHSDHYDILDSYFESWIGLHPRRTAEAFKNQYEEAKFIEDNPAPRSSTLSELVNWHNELVGHESKLELP